MYCTSNECFTNEVGGVGLQPVAPDPGLLGVGGAEEPQQDVVLASVGGGVTAPP